jgi:hypothetical protein
MPAVSGVAHDHDIAGFSAWIFVTTIQTMTP